ncbi:hypothetical protein AMJ49_03480 [Parcubacteria bacterium DG_74_2]|nr:MAG: hypothetical protein AMJ49_03480 [Parcubacteria bacterium DG_74_2]
MTKNDFKKNIIWISFCLGLLFIFGFAKFAMAESASLYLSPSSGTFFIGSTFDISIFVNTGDNNINALKVDLKFDPKKLQISTPTAGRSFITVWISQPVFSNIEGTATFQGGVPSPGINTSSGLVSTITFRAIAPGEAVVSILDSSKVLLDNGKGTNILSSVGKGIYKITIPPPEGPKVFSSTHPDQNKWYSNNSPAISWEKEEMVTDFSYIIDNNPFGVPDNISEGDQTSVSYTNLEDGIWYFHIKAKKGEVWGGISHYILLIDTTPPAGFTLSFEPVVREGNFTSREPMVSFITTDAISGIAYYQIKTIDLEKTEKKSGVEFFVEVSSPYQLPSLEPGEYQVVIRAFDLAGNWRDASEKIEVIPIEKLFYLSKKGIYVLTIFLPWPITILILFLIIFFILLSIFLRWREYNKLRRKKKDLTKLKAKLKKNGEEIRIKLFRIPK